MIYEIIYAESVQKQIHKLPREVQERVLSALERIRIRPEAYVKKLVGCPGYRLRAGDYRVIMDIDAGKLLILVIKVGHRKNIYG